MYEFSRALGDSVKKARTDLHLTQAQLAEKLDIDQRTIISIENYVGNPKMQILFPLIRVLKINPNDIFFPEIQQQSSEYDKLRFLLSDCTSDEIDKIFPLMKNVIALIKENEIV